MRRFIAAHTVVAAAGAVALATLAAVRISAQTPVGSVKAQAAAIVTRTPWGDPDLQGNYTNLYEQGTPLERPEEFDGRTLDDVTGEELAKLKAEVQARTINGFEGPIHAPNNWWQDALDLKRGGQAWFIVDPPDGHVPSLTPDGRQRAAAMAALRNNGRGAADSWEDRSLYDRCITRGIPGSMMPSIYGNSYQILQGPGFVAIRYEMIHETRIIPLDSHPHVGRNVHLDMGDARGRWEGETLVVETTNLKARSVYRNANPDTLKLLERFTRVAPNKVRWSVTVNDPSTWTRPWTFSMPLTENDAEPLMPYECHEGNYGLRNILSAARADDRKAAGAALNGVTSEERTAQPERDPKLTPEGR
jgi:hypothetical protein